MTDSTLRLKIEKWIKRLDKEIEWSGECWNTEWELKPLRRKLKRLLE